MRELTNHELAGEYTRQHIKIFGISPTSIDTNNRDAIIIASLDLITLSEFKNEHNHDETET